MTGMHTSLWEASHCWFAALFWKLKLFLIVIIKGPKSGYLYTNSRAEKKKKERKENNYWIHEVKLNAYIIL